MTKEEAWSAFADQYNHRLHGPSDAFKFAWDAATKAEREACAKTIDEMHLYGFSDVREFEMATLQDAAKAIRARGEA